MLKLYSRCSSGSFLFCLRWWWRSFIRDFTQWSPTWQQFRLKGIMGTLIPAPGGDDQSISDESVNLLVVFSHHGHLLLPIYGVLCVCKCIEETQRTVAIRPPGGAARWLGEGPVQPIRSLDFPAVMRAEKCSTAEMTFKRSEFEWR